VIVVAGGSGLLGGRVVAALIAQGQEVRVLTRDKARAAAALGTTPEIVEVDVRRPDGLDEALQGSTTVISAFHGFLGGRGEGPDEVDKQGNANLFAAARAAGSSVVLMSTMGASADSPADLFRAKFAAEQKLRASGVPWCIIRPGPYIETWQRVLQETAGRSGRPLVFGRGEQPLAFVAVDDVVALAARAATDPALVGEILEIGGEPISLEQLALAVQTAHGWPGKPRHLPRAVLRVASVVAGPFSPTFARQNRLAIVMDTTNLGEGDPDLRSRLGLPPARTVSDVLELP
jgi:NADH dehydrogenase